MKKKQVNLIPYTESEMKKLFLIMKLTLIFFFIGVLQVSATVFSQTTVDLDIQEKPISEVLKIIEQQSQFRFFYSDDLLALGELINIKVDNRNINGVLDEIFAETPLTYKTYDNNLVVILPREILQQHRITGIVTDATNGDPLPGVNVMIEGTLQGTVTDIEGKYSIDVPTEEGVLVFSYVGYLTERISAGNQAVININLSADVTNLEEVVVIGYGSRAKKDVTTSISSINTKDIAVSSVISPELSLQGKTSGIFIQSGGGNPNSRPTIRIRGTNTWGVSDPLYVIDGIPITEYGSGAESSTGAGTDSDVASLVRDLRGNMNVMNMINPDDIESISVLKDASAAAIYGVRAANGVILITTKKGKTGKPKIDFSMRTGIQNIPKKYDMLNTAQYVELYQEAYENNPDETGNMPSVFDLSSSDYLGNSETYDWISPLYNKNAKTSDYNLRLSGGTEHINYYISTGYASTESPLIRNNLDRYTLATNMNAKINKFISTGINYRIAYQEAKDNTPGDPMSVATAPPWQPVYDENGVNGYASAVEINYNPDFISSLIYGPATKSNLYGLKSTSDNSYTNLRNMGNVFLEFEPVKDLRFKGSISVDWYTQVRDMYTLFCGNSFSITPTDYSTYGDGNSYGTVSERISRNINMVKEFSVTYIKSFEEHHFELLFNAMDQSYSYYSLGAGSEQLSSPDPNMIMIEEGSTGFSAGGEYKSKSALQGYLGRLSYNYNSKYYLEGVVRRDGSSRFAKGHRWGVFPAFSAAWRISAESFMKNFPFFITDLKLRAGWGQMGNQEVKLFGYLSSISLMPHTSFGSSIDGRGIYISGAAAGDFANEDLTWERTTTTNLGLDGTLFKSLIFTIEYYNKVTDDLIQEATLPLSTGIENSPLINVGKVRNRGMEIMLGYNGRVGELNYTVNANLTTVDNEVLEMYNHTPLGSTYGSRIEEGYPLYCLWDYKMGGIFQSDEEVSKYQSTTDDQIASSQSPGDIWFLDLNGDGYEPGADGKINDNDRTYLGKTIPGYFYGFNFNMNYKGVDFACYFSGVGDVKKINYFRVAAEGMQSRGLNQSIKVLNRWTASNHSNKIPRAVASDPAGNTRSIDRWIENASYFRLNNVQIGYTIPEFKTINKINKTRVWVGASNLFTITEWSGLDPENETSPIPRVFSIGFEASF